MKKKVSEGFNGFYEYEALDFTDKYTLLVNGKEVVIDSKLSDKTDGGVPCGHVIHEAPAELDSWHLPEKSLEVDGELEFIWNGKRCFHWNGRVDVHTRCGSIYFVIPW